jgi:transcriptional regulator with XRE-family HTH domain
VNAVGNPEPKRQRLAAELLRLRDRSGLSGRALAPLVGISQSKVSRIEAGTTTPSVREVTRWADAVGTTVEVRAELESLTEAVLTEVHTWRALLRHRSHLQDDIGAREAAARRVLTFQPSIVPGLLQTADYASKVFSFFQLPYAPPDIAAAVAGRLNRQAVLHRGGQFEFVVTESALRWRPGAPRLLIAQLERLSSLSTSESISFGIILLRDEAIAAIPHGFVIYEDAEGDANTYVTVETIHANVDVTEPADVLLYQEQWSLLHRMAIFADDARQFVALLIEDLRQAPA